MLLLIDTIYWLPEFWNGSWIIRYYFILCTLLIFQADTFKCSHIISSYFLPIILNLGNHFKMHISVFMTEFARDKLPLEFVFTINSPFHCDNFLYLLCLFIKFWIEVPETEGIWKNLPGAFPAELLRKETNLHLRWSNHQIKNWAPEFNIFLLS